MLRLLFRLWWLQQRRSFTWKDAVVGGYLIFVYVMVGLGFYFGATLDGEELFEDGTPDALCAILVLTMLVPDIILKVVMKHDSTAMDDYLKSRPVPEKVWNRFCSPTLPISGITSCLCSCSPCFSGCSACLRPLWAIC